MSTHIHYATALSTVQAEIMTASQQPNLIFQLPYYSNLRFTLLIELVDIFCYLFCLCSTTATCTHQQSQTHTNTRTDNIPTQADRQTHIHGHGHTQQHTQTHRHVWTFPKLPLPSTSNKLKSSNLVCGRSDLVRIISVDDVLLRSNEALVCCLISIVLTSSLLALSFNYNNTQHH